MQCADGQWRTLDGRSLHLFRAGAAAERTTEEYLTRVLGVRLAMRPDGKAREVVGISTELIGALSSRDRAIGPKLAEPRLPVTKTGAAGVGRTVQRRGAPGDRV